MGGGTPPPSEVKTGDKQLIMRRLSGKVLVGLRVKMARNYSIQKAYGENRYSKGVRFRSGGVGMVVVTDGGGLSLL